MTPPFVCALLFSSVQQYIWYVFPRTHLYTYVRTCGGEQGLEREMFLAVRRQQAPDPVRSQALYIYICNAWRKQHIYKYMIYVQRIKKITRERTRGDDETTTTTTTTTGESRERIRTIASSHARHIVHMHAIIRCGLRCRTIASSHAKHVVYMHVMLRPRMQGEKASRKAKGKKKSDISVWVRWLYGNVPSKRTYWG